MAAPKGTRPPAAGMGRQLGSKNKVTQDLRQMILAALDGAGGQAYLQRQADENPSSFLTLIGKVLPTVVSNPDGSNLFKGITVKFERPG